MNAPAFSQARKAEGPLLFVSGQLPLDARGTPVSGGIREQATAVFDRIAIILDAEGGSLADVVKLTYFLTDMADLAQLREVISEYFEDPKPASTLVQVSALVEPEFLLEIDAIAALRADAS
ncbi:RidA family protein [Arthrobacter sp. TMN-49]